MPTIKEHPVESLGRWYEGNLKDKSRGVQIQRQLEDGLKAIDETKLPEKYKIWCLQFGLYPRIAWPRMMYETAASRVDIMEQKCNVMIRRWLVLPRMTNTAALSRQKGSFQLPLTAITEIYKAGKVRTVMILRESADIEIRSNPPAVETARKWNAEDKTNHLISSLQHRDIIGSKQSDKKGLECNAFKPFASMNKKERRAAVCNQVKEVEAEKRELHIIQCAQQGHMTKLEENVVERKISWNEIWKWITSRLSFLVRSTYDVLPSPANLVRWKVVSEDTCRCGKVGTMKHILSNCPLVLNRYTWRHNEVLKVLYDVTSKQLDEINNGKRLQKTKISSSIKFVRPGQKDIIRTSNKLIDNEKWTESWKVAADLPGKQKPFVIPTTKKPDIIVWCSERKEVHLVELTVPHEDNIGSSEVRKDDRYKEFLKNCEDAECDATHFPVEIGRRDFIGNRLKKWLIDIGLQNATSTKRKRKSKG